VDSKAEYIQFYLARKKKYKKKKLKQTNASAPLMSPINYIVSQEMHQI